MARKDRTDDGKMPLWVESLHAQALASKQWADVSELVEARMQQILERRGEAHRRPGAPFPGTSLNFLRAEKPCFRVTFSTASVHACSHNSALSCCDRVISGLTSWVEFSDEEKKVLIDEIEDDIRREPEYTEFYARLGGSLDKRWWALRAAPRSGALRLTHAPTGSSRRRQRGGRHATEARSASEPRGGGPFKSLTSLPARAAPATTAPSGC
jgi:hypothetical protein